MSSSRAPAEHNQFLALAATAIDFRLSPDEERRLRDHLAQCPACAHAAAALRQDASVLSRQPRADAPWTVQDAVLQAASARRATGQSSGRPSIGPMLGLALLIVALAGSVFVAGSVLNTRIPPGPDTTQPVTVVRPSQPPRRTTEPPETPEPRTPRPALARARWTALGDLTDQFGGGEVTLVTASPEGGYLAFGLDPTGTTPIVWSSTNGRAWREVDRPADTFGSGAPTDAAPGGDGLVVVGRNVQTRGAQKAMWSTADGRQWRQLTDISSQIATRQGSIRVAAGPLGLVAWLNGGRAWWSSNGMDWRRTQDLPSGVTDAVVGDDEVIAIGRDGDRVWVARSADGIAWPSGSRSEPAGQAPTSVSPGVERATGLQTLVWSGRDRFEPAGEGRWERATTGQIPMPLTPRQVQGGPRGYLAIGAIDPGSGDHRAWTWDGEGSWKAVAGSDDGLSRPDGMDIVGIVPDDAGWLILIRQGIRFTGWRVER